jgi:hypothetical protein
MLTLDTQNIGLALPHKLWSNDAGIDWHAKNAWSVAN